MPTLFLYYFFLYFSSIYGLKRKAKFGLKIFNSWQGKRHKTLQLTLSDWGLDAFALCNIYSVTKSAYIYYLGVKSCDRHKYHILTKLNMNVSTIGIYIYKNTKEYFSKRFPHTPMRTLMMME